MEPSNILILQALTGSGKTAYAAAAAHEHSVIALSHTKVLQRENYGITYGFDYLFGRGNYRCALDESHSARRCYHKQRPSRCPMFAACRYYIQRGLCQNSHKTALNYAYWMTAKWPREKAASALTVMDEAHLLSDLVIEHSSVTVTDKQRRQFNLPDFPLITSRGQSMGMQANPVDSARKWLARARVALTGKMLEMESKINLSPTFRKKYDATENLWFSIVGAQKSLTASPNNWFIRSGPRARELQYGRRAPGFVCKPLTARHHFPRMFLMGGPALLMSATIGNFETFAQELGIEGARTLRVPSVWTPEMRPVYYDEGAPSIGNKTSRAGYEKQADIIAKMLRSVPSHWTGVIHVTSKKRAQNLGSMLAMRGLADRIWTPSRGAGTEQQMDEWEKAKQIGKGRLAIAWSWWVGMDLLDEKINIVAKTPYPFLGSEYGRERMLHNGKMYLQRTAWRLQQGCGRTRRGRPQDYDIDGKRAGLVAVVDQNWKRVRNYMDDDFLQSMTAW
ncbi:hypothetical protein GF380_04255 [Candidatus Uhrbacteria bacterium]|nr:hypothetical protein [Candidatus Uhrbacteria bacterium]